MRSEQQNQRSWPSKILATTIVAASLLCCQPVQAQYGGTHGYFPNHHYGDHDIPYWQRDSFSDTGSTGFTRRDDWYSPYQQYAPPTKHYVPTASKPIFAQCKFEANGQQQRIQLAQLPNKAPIVVYDFNNIGNNAATAFTLQINEFGVTTQLGCATDVGEEFNPLESLDEFGNVKQFQDPSYGKLPGFTSNGSGTVLGNGSYKSEEPITFLGNLEGRYSIIGRSISVVDPGDGSIIGCCPIVIEHLPADFSPTIAQLSSVQHFGSYGSNLAVQNGSRAGHRGSHHHHSPSSYIKIRGGKRRRYGRNTKTINIQL